MAPEDVTGTGALPRLPERLLDETTRAALSEVYQRIDQMKTEYAEKFEGLVGNVRETQVLVKNNANNMAKLEEIQREGAKQQTELRDAVRDLINNNGHLTKRIDAVGTKASEATTRADEACDKANEIIRSQEQKSKETQKMKALEEGKKKRWQTLWDKVFQAIVTAVILGVLLFLGNAAWEHFKGKVHDNHNTEVIDDQKSQ